MSGTQGGAVIPDDDNADVELTEEERAALAEPDDGANGDPDNGQETVPAGKTGDAKPPEGKDAQPGADTENPGADSQPAGRDDGGAVDDEPTTSPQVLRPSAPEGAADRLKAIDTERTELAQKFDDGELTGKEFREADKKLEEERAGLAWAIQKDELAGELNSQQRERDWFREVNEFVAAHPEVKENETLWAAFDLHVRKVTGSEDAKGLSDRKMLAKAFDGWKKDLGRDKPAAPAPKVEPKPTAERPALPPTLRNAPAAEAPNASDGEFEALDRLANTDPLAYEAAMAKLSDAQRERYLAAG